MYVIKTDADIIYSPIITDRIVYGASLEMELNTASKLTFTIPESNPINGKLHKLKTLVYVYWNDEELFRGRVLESTRDFYNNKKVTCEGELRFLIDSVIRPYSHNGSIRDYINVLLSAHNSQVEDYKHFQLGRLNVTDSNGVIVRSNSDYTNTLEELKAKLVENESLGGNFYTRHENNICYLDYMKDYARDTEHVIEFGENLLDLEEYVDASSVFTVLIPTGKATAISGDEETEVTVTIESVNNGQDFIVDTSGVALFGVILKHIEYEDISIPSNLLTKGKQVLSDAIKESLTLTVKAVDLSLIGLASDSIRLGDSVRVVSEPHGINEKVIVSSIRYDLGNPANTEFTLGSQRKTLTKHYI